jgi:hypothetical protein
VRAGVNSVVGCPVSKKQAVYYFENNSWSNPCTRPRIRMTSCLASNVLPHMAAHQNRKHAEW